MTGIDDTKTTLDANTGWKGSTTDLFAAWERRTKLWALIFAALTLVVSAFVALVVIRAGRATGVTLVLALVPVFLVYAWQTRKIRRRHAILSESFPPEWEVVLQRDVVFFRVLNAAAQQRFRSQVRFSWERSELLESGCKSTQRRAC